MTSTIFFFTFIPLLSTILLGVNFLLAPHNPYKEKKTPFECGYHSFLSQNRSQFTISFFIFGLLFLIFDLEIVLIYPYSVSSYANNIYGLVIMLIFTLIVTIGFIFELGKNALKIESKQYNSLQSNPKLTGYRTQSLPVLSPKESSIFYITKVIKVLAYKFLYSGLFLVCINWLLKILNDNLLHKLKKFITKPLKDFNFQQFHSLDAFRLSALRLSNLHLNNTKPVFIFLFFLYFLAMSDLTIAIDCKDLFCHSVGLILLSHFYSYWLCNNKEIKQKHPWINFFIEIFFASLISLMALSITINLDNIFSSVLVKLFKVLLDRIDPTLLDIGNQENSSGANSSGTAGNSGGPSGGGPSGGEPGGGGPNAGDAAIAASSSSQSAWNKRNREKADMYRIFAKQEAGEELTEKQKAKLLIYSNKFPGDLQFNLARDDILTNADHWEKYWRNDKEAHDKFNRNRKFEVEMGRIYNLNIKDRTQEDINKINLHREKWRGKCNDWNKFYEIHKEKCKDNYKKKH